MTEKLFHTDLTECVSKVLSCEEKDGKYFVLLNRSIIFPEGGGQPADHGTVGEALILDAQEYGDDVVHILDRPLKVGEEYAVRLDITRRMDHSEQHTGEHILSGTAWRLFEAKNVGFHMAEDYCTLDLDKFLDPEALALLESEANAAVRRNVPVTAEVMDRERFDSITIRKKSDVKSDDIRVVFIGGGEVDSCTCCGTHCASSGEVGYIRIADSQKYKGGTRIWFSCGGRAVSEANAISRELTEIARSYSTSRDELPQALRKQSEELSEAKRQLKARTQALCAAIADANTDEAAVLVMDGFSANDVKLLTDALTAGNARVALVFGQTGNTVFYRAVRREGEELPMNDVVSAVNGLLNGKGGGNPGFAQGSARGKVGRETLETIGSYIEKRRRLPH